MASKRSVHRIPDLVFPFQILSFRAILWKQQVTRSDGARKMDGVMVRAAAPRKRRIRDAGERRARQHYLRVWTAGSFRPERRSDDSAGFYGAVRFLWTNSADSSKKPGSRGLVFMLPPDFDGRRRMEKMGDNRRDLRRADGGRNRKGTRDWSMGRAIGIFLRFFQSR